MQIVCASMRKLLHQAFGVLKNDRCFDPNLTFAGWRSRQYLISAVPPAQRTCQTIWKNLWRVTSVGQMAFGGARHLTVRLGVVLWIGNHGCTRTRACAKINDRKWTNEGNWGQILRQCNTTVKSDVFFWPCAQCANALEHWRESAFNRICQCNTTVFLQAVCALWEVRKQRAFSKFFCGEFNTIVELLNLMQSWPLKAVWL